MRKERSDGKQDGQPRWTRKQVDDFAAMILADERVPPVLKLCKLALVAHLNRDEADCYPSIKTIAKETGLYVRSVRRAMFGDDEGAPATVPPIESFGYFRFEKGRQGRKHPNRYIALIAEKCASRALSENSGKVRLHTEKSAPQSAPQAHRTLEPSVEEESSTALRAAFRPPEQEKKGANALVFSEGVSLLVESGIEEPRARSFIGSCLKDGHRPDVVLASIRKEALDDDGEDILGMVKSDLAERPARPLPIAVRWCYALAYYRLGEWWSDLGPRPGKPGCLIPEPLIAFAFDKNRPRMPIEEFRRRFLAIANKVAPETTIEPTIEPTAIPEPISRALH